MKILKCLVIAAFVLACTGCMAVETPVAKGLPQVRDIGPISVKFGPPDVRFVGPEAPELTRLLKVVKEHYLRDDYVLDKALTNATGYVFAKGSGRGVKDVFRVTNSLAIGKDNKDLLDASSIQDVLGQPEVVLGPVEEAVVYQWRFCNGKVGDTFKALEITAALQREDIWRIKFLVSRKTITTKHIK